MDFFLYIIIFLMGLFFGSFYTLAVYRIPKKQDIVHTHSFCPNCNHKLGFLELFPVFSYIFQGGKCKHCKEPIRIRYLIIELLSGITFVLFALALKINISEINVQTIIAFAFLLLYLTCLFLIAGIDKENKVIEKPVLAYGILIATIYIVYLYIMEQASIYRYGIYLILFIILLILDSRNLKKNAKNSYVYSILLLSIIMVIFTGELIYISTVIGTLLAIAFYLLMIKIKDRRTSRKRSEENAYHKQICIGYIMCVIHIIICLTMMFWIR